MSDTITFTEEQIANWRAYERVRQSGKFNMFDPRARRASGLGEDGYLFSLRNYSALRATIYDPRRGVWSVTTKE